MSVAPTLKVEQKLVLPSHRDAYYGGTWHAPIEARYVEGINPGTGESLGKVMDGAGARPQGRDRGGEVCFRRLAARAAARAREAVAQDCRCLARECGRAGD